MGMIDSFPIASILLLYSLGFMQIKYRFELVYRQLIVPIAIMLAHDDINLLVTYFFPKFRECSFYIVNGYLTDLFVVKFFKNLIYFFPGQNNLDIHRGSDEVINRNTRILVVIQMGENLLKIFFVHF